MNSAPKPYTPDEWFNLRSSPYWADEVEYPRVDATVMALAQAKADLESLRQEVSTLRVKNKFLREKTGYFRDDIESKLDSGKTP